eukprot:scaffold112022_cov41-Tisochrysis_lutea.AAC.1
MHAWTHLLACLCTLHGRSEPEDILLFRGGIVSRFNGMQQIQNKCETANIGHKTSFVASTYPNAANEVAEQIVVLNSIEAVSSNAFALPWCFRTFWGTLWHVMSTDPETL